MRNWKKIILFAELISLVFAGVRAETATNSNAGQLFKFKFELNKPLVYSLETRNTKVTDGTFGGRTSLVKNSASVRIKFRLTAVSTNQNGDTTVLYEPFDFEQDLEVNNAAGHLATSFRGLDIVGKQNDIIMVDTSKGIGMADAKNMKMSAYGTLLSGYFDIDPSGNVTRLDGDLPFQDYWRETLKNALGFFQIEFPTNAISIRDSWTNNIVLKSFGGAAIMGDGIIQSYVFSREPDASTKDGALACFSLYESEHGKNLSGYVEQSGQRTSLVIPERLGSINTTFHFDPKNGRLVDSKKNERLDDSVSMMVQGNANSSHGNCEIESTLRLISP